MIFLQYLWASGLYESLDEAILREEVLGLFYQLVQLWVKSVCRKKNLNVEDARAHVYTFGSYRLGVHGPGKLCGPPLAEWVISLVIS